VLGVDRLLDIALIELETPEPAPIIWAQALPGIGTPVLAAGDPGSGLRVTQGHVSAGPLTMRSRQGRPVELIEHTAPLPRGSGGGPLLDTDGALLGVNALRGDPGFVLALPAPILRPALDRLLAGHATPRLGLALYSGAASARMRDAVGLPERPGLLVRAVEAESPAERAGIRAGDMLVGLGASALASTDELFAALETCTGNAEVRIVRAEREQTLKVELA